MYPILFQYKVLSIGGYGVMLGLGFYFAFLLAEREFILRGKDPNLAYKILLAAIPCGIIGSKLFHILEHLDEFQADPAGMIFSGAGLSAYGGILLSLLVCGIIVYRNKESFLEMGDIAAPSLMLGYCFGRFGCHVAGDGCYGIPSFGFLGTAYPNGIVPSTITVFPTPLFEVAFAVAATGVLLQARKYEWKKGNLFFLYLILTGLPRFLVEFIRTNPKLISWMSQAQVISVALVLCGCAGIAYNAYKERRAAA
ncbi:MAG: prolipoprotein diacylglyceryl transferase [Spirochaetota bacterium]